MKQLMFTKLSLITTLLLTSSVVYAEEVLGDISVEEDSNSTEESLAYCYIHNVKALSKRKGAGETLGDYLSGELGVESATYGSAVGRPTVNGMEGYRVGIAQGGIMLNDLSAMSQDHAVGLNAKVAEHLELVKGPASLLYGSYSGGIVRTLGEEHEAKLPKGFGANASLSSNSDTGKGTANLKAEYGNEDYSGYINYYRNEAGNYSSGGTEIQNSDTFSEQLHGVLGWQATDNTVVKVYGDTMDKNYGIPNKTTERTDILMEQQRYGVVIHNKELGKLKNVQTEYQLSDYKHFEREGTSYDGAFDQQQQSVSTAFDFAVNDDMDGNFRAELLENELKVCHEHGACNEFSTAVRTTATDGLSLQNQYNSRGITFSHGHPMPNTKEQKLQMGVNLKRYYDEDEFSLAVNTVLRKLTPDNSNIQETWLMPTSIDADYYTEETDVAISASLGWWHIWSDALTTQASLAYMERLPSSQELLWNGFHHATESYILGNRDIDKERSVNLDVNMLYTHNENFNSKLSAYYYHFDNYIYQSPLAQNGSTVIDPFHSSPVWEIRGAGAKIYGLGIEESYKMALGKHKFTNTLQLNMLRGELDEGGAIPRMAPYNATASIEHQYNNLTNKISYKWVDKSRNVASNESETASYSFLNASINYEQKLGKSKMLYWLKGENLTDDIATNHISFLKETAPLPGRAIIAGIEYQY